MPRAADQKRVVKRARRNKVRIKCAYKACRNRQKECKNVGHVLPMAKINKQQCRRLRSHCKLVRFCCHSHQQECRLKAKKPKRSGREALTAEQLGHLLSTLINKVGAPWAAVLCLFQLVLGERADCARRLDAAWLSNLSAGSASLPMVTIPKVNGKTTPRTVPIPAFLATLMSSWMDQPLPGAHDSQWPFPGHDLQQHVEKGTQRLLFPGRQLGGQNIRNWQRPVTERGYLEKLEMACQHIALERAEDRLAGKKHIFENVDLKKVGTHTFKKSCVTLLKDAKVSNAVISAITGTSVRTLEDVYDYPTTKRQREATEVFADVFPR